MTPEHLVGLVLSILSYAAWLIALVIAFALGVALASTLRRSRGWVRGTSLALLAVAFCTIAVTVWLTVALERPSLGAGCVVGEEILFAVPVMWLSLGSRPQDPYVAHVPGRVGEFTIAVAQGATRDYRVRESDLHLLPVIVVGGFALLSNVPETDDSATVLLVERHPELWGGIFHAMRPSPPGQLWASITWAVVDGTLVATLHALAASRDDLPGW